ncbi:lipase [Leptothermofonsia sichuanensis E412]|uniref:lipase family alpha/beta hydrolase n=1 Tax=Leptothermofonsia sichuanensis TaxID=2917832 RepID=UPI001CA6C250|nr:lipase [Leptothermofonsia sichuanensis]QZZ20784.1 lipase [Leptothermofonsia sichuanensis E412]
MGLPTVILPGYLAGASEYLALEQALQAKGIPASVVPIRWHDWLPTLGGRSVTPILRKLDRTMKQVLQQHRTARINLVGHSAGGWLSRIYMGEKPYCIHPSDTEDCVWNARESVATLVTLGTPHTSLERWTRRNLDFVNLSYPGAFYPEVRYVCVAGRAVYGDRLKSWLAYSSYKLTCGQGNCWGDGITPISSAHLEGAENLILEGVRHSPKAGRWYGSPDSIDAWLPYLA